MKNDNTKHPLVSFIIPCYNLPADMVTECITSIMDLSLGDDEREIIVIDDGSERPLINDIRPLADRITYIRQPNRGLSASRNMGISIAKGMYIQFVDGDDRLIKEAYEHCLDIARYDNPDMVLFYNTADKLGSDIYDKPECETGAHFMANNSLHAAACGYIFRRDMLHDLRFTTGIYHEDEEFTPLLMLRAERLFNVRATAYYYRQRPGSIMNTPTAEMLRKRFDDMEYVINSLREKTFVLNLTDRKALERRVAQLTVAHLYQIIRLTHSSRQLEERIGRLREKELFPLPDKRYNRKYTLFRIFSGNRMLRWILLLAIR